MPGPQGKMGLAFPLIKKAQAAQERVVRLAYNSETQKICHVEKQKKRTYI